MSAPLPTRHVRVVQDTHSPLWMLRCVEPCRSGEMPDSDRTFCMRSSIWQSKAGLCYLGCAATREAAEAYARRLGYTVEPAP